MLDGRAQASPVTLGPVLLSLPGCAGLVRVLHLDVEENLEPLDGVAFLRGDADGSRHLTADEPRKPASEARAGLVLDGKIPLFLLGMLVAECRHRPMVAVRDPRLPACLDGAGAQQWSSAVVVHSDQSGEWPEVGARIPFPHCFQPGGARAGAVHEPRMTWRDSLVALVEPLPVRVLEVDATATSPEMAAASLDSLQETDVRGAIVMVDGARAAWHFAMLTDRLVSLQPLAVAVRTIRLASTTAGPAAVVVYSQDPRLEVGRALPFPTAPRRGSVYFFGARPSTGKSVLTHQVATRLIEQRFPCFRLAASPDGDGAWFFSLERHASTPFRKGVPMGEKFVLDRLAALEAARHNQLLVLLDAGGLASEDNRRFLERCDGAVWLARADDPDVSEWDRLNETACKPVIARILVAKRGAIGGASHPALRVSWQEPAPFLEGTLEYTDGGLGPAESIELLSSFLAWYPLLPARPHTASELVDTVVACIEAIGMALQPSDLGAIHLAYIVESFAELSVLEPGKWQFEPMLDVLLRVTGWPMDAAWELARRSTTAEDRAAILERYSPWVAKPHPKAGLLSTWNQTWERRHG